MSENKPALHNVVKELTEALHKCASARKVLESDTERLASTVERLRHVIEEEGRSRANEKYRTEHEKQELEESLMKLQHIIGLKDEEIAKLSRLLPAELVPLIKSVATKFPMHWKPRT